MAVVTPSQANFNGGELSRRLHAREDLNIYGIGLAECAGWLPTVEGGLEAAPGTFRVEGAAGPCRLIPFEYNLTQGYVIEASAGKARFYTNDGRIEEGGAPIELALPYSKADIDELTWEASYDVLYLFHGRYQTRQLVRTAADAFELVPLVLENGPFEKRNKDQSITVSATAVSGDVTLAATSPIFAAGDVGGLFQLEADDFGDIALWQPGITVTSGQLLTWNDRVYRVAGGSGRTGQTAPIHNEGIEWDGIGAGTDINTKPAGGVQLEYIHDRFGVLTITGFTDSTHVSATVLRRLPFTAADSYDYGGGYYDPDWDDYTPPEDSVSYVAGTWRWRFGAFSDRRGWPSCGVVWNERLVLAKDSTLYAGVTGDLPNHATYDELGEISNDMALVAGVSNPNRILSMVADEKLLILTASGLFALGPSNAAAGVGPKSKRVDRQNNEGAAAAMPVQLDGRTVYIGKSRRRAIEGGYSVQSNKQDAADLTRYARHLGAPRFIAIASTKDPARLLWACRGDGSLAAATYVPEEQVLGWVRRPLGSGVAARSIAACSDPSGELDQLWIAAEFAGAWHVLRMAQVRQEGDTLDPPMTDMTAEYQGEPASVFGPAPWLASRTVQVWADERAYTAIAVDGAGLFTLPERAGHVRAGLAYPASFTTLRPGAGTSNGSSLGKAQRVSRLKIDVLKARGLRVTAQAGLPRHLEQLMTDSVLDEGYGAVTGVVIAEDAGDWDRTGQVTIERVAPVGATVRAIVPSLDVSDK